MTGWQVSQCPLQSEWNAFLIFFSAPHTLRPHAVRGFAELSHGRSGGPPLFHQFRGKKKVESLLHNGFFLCTRDSSGMSRSYLGVFKKVYLALLNKLFISSNSSPKHV